MTKDVFFRTNLVKNKIFKPDLFYNEYFGKDLAEWLIDNFRGSDFSLTGPYQGDWGWEIDAKNNKERFNLKLGIMEDSIGGEILEWLIVIEKPQSWLSFGKPDTTNFEKFCRKIDEILVNEPQVSEISWKV